MEVSLQSRLILAAKAARPKAAEDPDAEESGILSAEAAPETDKLTLTNQAVEKLNEQAARLKNLLEEPAEAAQLLPVPPAPWEASAEEEKSKDELDAMTEGLKAMRKCMEIARRIMRGDKVPPEDQQYLMENDPDGFKLAMAMRKPKKNPKEWESMLKDEKKSEQSGGDGGGEEAPSCESSGGASESGGGE